MSTKVYRRISKHVEVLLFNEDNILEAMTFCSFIRYNRVTRGYDIETMYGVRPLINDDYIVRNGPGDFEIIKEYHIRKEYEEANTIDQKETRSQN